MAAQVVESGKAEHPVKGGNGFYLEGGPWQAGNVAEGDRDAGRGSCWDIAEDAAGSDRSASPARMQVDSSETQSSLGYKVWELRLCLW